MAIYIVNPNSQPLHLDQDAADLDTLLRLLEAENLEHVPGLTSYNDEPAEMIGDELSAIVGKPYNDVATRLRDVALLADGYPPTEAPIHGAVVILTGAHRLAR